MNQTRLKTAHIDNAFPITIEPTEMRNGKPVIRYFVSYSHKDSVLKNEFLDRLRERLDIANSYCFVQWEDEDILPGERWHQQILAAIDHCQFGLLLVSPAFLGSEYIKKHELPAFVASNLNDPEPKRVIPVALRRIPLDDSIDRKGLENLQIFHDKAGKTFQERTGRLRDEFAAELFQQILKIVRRYGTLLPNPNLHSQDTKLCAPLEDEIKPDVVKSAQELIVVILQQSDAATLKLAARFGLDSGQIVECRQRVAEKTLNTPLEELFEIALEEQQGLDRDGANVIARLVQATLPFLNASDDAEADAMAIRTSHATETNTLHELHASHKTFAELIMAKADQRPTAFLRPRNPNEFPGSDACLPYPPEGGRDPDGLQFKRDCTEELAQKVEPLICAEFKNKFTEYLRDRFEITDSRKTDETGLIYWINDGLRRDANRRKRQYLPVRCGFAYYFLVETPAGLDDALRKAQDAVLLDLKARFPDIAFLRLAPPDPLLSELRPYSQLIDLLCILPEPDSWNSSPSTPTTTKILPPVPKLELGNRHKS